MKQIASHNGVTMVIERRWWWVRLTFEIDGIVGQETSCQWSSSSDGALTIAGVELGAEMARLSFADWLASGTAEQHHYQLKFMEWGPAEVEEETAP